jgi:soluble lytic murein transglycosylase-like protein
MDRADSTQVVRGGANSPPGGIVRSGIRTAGWRILLAALALSAALPGLGLFAAAPAAADRQIYTFVDERGVTHFTNLPPRDERYRPIPRRTMTPRSFSFGPAPRNWGYDGLIGLTAREHRVQPALVKAVIAAESNFDPGAVSRKGARGLMQLMPETAEELGVDDSFEPSANVRGGTRYLRSMLDRYGDLSRAIAAYNAGPTAVDRYGGIPPYRETQDYVNRVLTYYRAYHGDFGR